MSFKAVFKFVFAWRLLLLIAAIPAIFLIPLRSGFTALAPGFKLSYLLEMWANFDGIHYLNLAKYGYNAFYTGYLQAFFPLYPLAVQSFSRFIGFLASGLLVSHLSLLLALYFLYRLIKLDHHRSIARLTLILLLIFPTAFFFGSVYSESFFLLLSVLAFYAARKKRWFLAALFISLSSATRLTGILLLPAILIEYWLAHAKNIKKSLHDLAWVWFLLAPVGLLAYMRFLQQSTGDPFYFATIQPLFGAQREVGRLVLLHQVFFRYAKMLVFVNHADPLFFTVLLESLTGGIFFVISLLAFKYSRLSYALYTFFSFILPTLTGTFSSLPRYILVLFPAFILLARWLKSRSKITRFAWYFVSGLLSLVAVSLFTRGYFIG